MSRRVLMLLGHCQVPMSVVEEVEAIMWPRHPVGVPLPQVDWQYVSNLGSFLVVAHLRMDGSMDPASIMPYMFHDVNLATHRPISKFVICGQHPSCCPRATTCRQAQPDFNTAILPISFSFGWKPSRGVVPLSQGLPPCLYVKGPLRNPDIAWIICVGLKLAVSPAVVPKFAGPLQWIWRSCSAKGLSNSTSTVAESIDFKTHVNPCQSCVIKLIGPNQRTMFCFREDFPHFDLEARLHWRWRQLQFMSFESNMTERRQLQNTKRGLIRCKSSR